MKSIKQLVEIIKSDTPKNFKLFNETFQEVEKELSGKNELRFFNEWFIESGKTYVEVLGRKKTERKGIDSVVQRQLIELMLAMKEEELGFRNELLQTWLIESLTAVHSFIISQPVSETYETTVSSPKYQNDFGIQKPCTHAGFFLYLH